MVLISQARTLGLALVLAVVALGLLAVRSARRAEIASSDGVVAAAVVTTPSTPGSAAAVRHGYRVTLGR